jgi:TRAP-type C4-dicarboxylate transport system substrate-binding protein
MLTNNKRPVNSAADLAGLKIRVPEAPISIAIFKALEANPTPVAFNELYGALQQKVVDGQENGYNTIAAGKFYEVQKYVAETNHMWGANPFYVSEKFYQSVPADIQKLIMECGANAGTAQRKLYRDMVAGSKQTCIDNGMQVSTPDLAGLKEKTKVVYTDFIKQYPQYESIIKEIQAL